MGLNPLPPDFSALLPPLFACLPAAFASVRPPPALLPLLSPILRQRVELLSDVSAESPENSWLPLLCWDAADGERLSMIIKNGNFEPHPVSGEIELGHVEPPRYRRLDQETLQSTTKVHELNLQVVYVWCGVESEGGASDWRLSELKPAEDVSQERSRLWSSSIADTADVLENEEHYRSSGRPNLQPPQQSTVSIARGNADSLHVTEDDGDDDFWAQYDNTPARTPAVKHSPAGNITETAQGTSGMSPSNGYFERYADVQPEMDNDDPSIDRAGFGESTLNDRVSNLHSLRHAGKDTPADSKPAAVPPADIIHTRASSSSSHLVAQLESSAECQSGAELASIAVQQHISTSIKSLYRLAKGVGIARDEFQRLIHTETEVLSMLENDDD